MSWADRVGAYLPDLPSLGREAEIAVFLIHNSADPEDYFFLFDFEEFVDRSKGGIFVRPVLRVFAGRNDFSRTRFARQFREVFSREFDRMRRDLGGKGEARGWLSWRFNVVDMVSDFVATMILGLALSVGRMVLGQVTVPRFLKGKSAEAKLADEIDTTKGQVEAALAALDVSVHPELLAHAERVGGIQKRADLEREAWPLPEFVREHLRDKKSGSWW